jgi:hypothetical protein
MPGPRGPVPAWVLRLYYTPRPGFLLSPPALLADPVGRRLPRSSETVEAPLQQSLTVDVRLTLIES